MKLLFLDVGNTKVKYLLTERESFKPIEVGYINFDELTELERFKQYPVYVSSVKPSYNAVVSDFFKNVRFIKLEDCKRFLKITYKSPGLGIDRVLSCIGGLEYNVKDFACIIFGTATTVNIVKNKTFISGAIFLGFQKELECLSQKAEQLPLLDLKNLQIEPLGDTTETNILGGVFYKHLFAVEGYIKTIRGKYNIETIFVSGGIAELFAERLKGVIHDPLLIFKGMFKVVSD